MGWLKLSAKQQRLLSKWNRTIDEQIILSSEEVKDVLYSKFTHVVYPTKKPVIVVAPDAKFICPDNGKVSDMHKNINYCSPWYPAPSDKNCVWFAKKSAVLMRGYAFGVMTVTLSHNVLHRLNVFINRHKEVVAWEPQHCNWPGSGYVKSIKVIHMGVGLENVGEHSEGKSDPFVNYDKLF